MGGAEGCTGARRQQHAGCPDRMPRGLCCWRRLQSRPQSCPLAAASPGRGREICRWPAASQAGTLNGGSSCRQTRKYQAGVCYRVLDTLYGGDRDAHAAPQRRWLAAWAAAPASARRCRALLPPSHFAARASRKLMSRGSMLGSTPGCCRNSTSRVDSCRGGGEGGGEGGFATVSAAAAAASDASAQAALQVNTTPCLLPPARFAHSLPTLSRPRPPHPPPSFLHLGTRRPSPAADAALAHGSKPYASHQPTWSKSLVTLRMACLRGGCGAAPGSARTVNHSRLHELPSSARVV